MSTHARHVFELFVGTEIAAVIARAGDEPQGGFPSAIAVCLREAVNESWERKGALFGRKLELTLQMPGRFAGDERDVCIEIKVTADVPATERELLLHPLRMLGHFACKALSTRVDDEQQWWRQYRSLQSQNASRDDRTTVIARIVSGEFRNQLQKSVASRLGIPPSTFGRWVDEAREQLARSGGSLDLLPRTNKHQ